MSPQAMIVANNKQSSFSALSSEKVFYVPVIPDPRGGSPQSVEWTIGNYTKETAIIFIDAYVSVLLDSYIIDISVYL